MASFKGVRLDALADAIARTFVHEAASFVNRTFSTTAAQTVGINAIATPELQRAIDLATRQNAQLIRSIASQHLDAIAGIVYKNVLAGGTPKGIEEEIRAYGVTASRARFIARDQTAKVVSAVSRIKQRSAGFEFFKWDTSHDERVRDSHKAVANAKTPYGIGVYRWDDLPKIHGEQLAPGGDYRCRCVALPVLNSEVEEWQKKHKK